MRRRGIIAAAAVIADQAVKLSVRCFPLGKVFFEIPGFISFEYCVNTGAAFSMLSGHPRMLALASLALLLIIAVYAEKRLRLTAYSWIAVECLIGGGIGNLLDRLFFSAVTDYVRLQFVEFPVFNLADALITCSIAVLMVLLLTDTLEETVEEKRGSVD